MSQETHTVMELLFPRIISLVLLLGTVRYVASDGGEFIIVNNCPTTVWLGVLSNAGVAPLQVSNVALSTSQSISVSTPPKWGGRFWGRTGCNFGAGTTTGTCATGDCNGQLICQGAGGKTPATLAEITLDGANGEDFYDVSLVDGYNLPIGMAPTDGGQGRNATNTMSCNAAGCIKDLNRDCPAALQVTTGGNVVGCRSACDAFGEPQYCCTAANGGSGTCPPTDYSKLFKEACPNAYSYAYDDKSSLFTCRGGAYTITFCPTSQPGGDGVDFPEAQPVPTGGDVNNGGVVVGANNRVLQPSRARAHIKGSMSPFLLALFALLQLRILL